MEIHYVSLLTHQNSKVVALTHFFLIGNFQTKQLSNKFMSKGQSNEVVLKFPKICEHY